MYTDDSQVYVSMLASDAAAVVACLTVFIADINNWRKASHLRLAGPTNYRAKCSYSRRSHCIICVHKSAKNLLRADLYFSNDMFSRKVMK